MKRQLLNFVIIISTIFPNRYFFIKGTNENISLLVTGTSNFYIGYTVKKMHGNIMQV